MSIKVYDSKASVIYDVKEHNPYTHTKANNYYYVYKDSWDQSSLAIENKECCIQITHKSVDRLVECLLLYKETHRMIVDKLENSTWLDKVKNVRTDP